MTFEEANNLLGKDKYHWEALGAFDYNNCSSETSLCDSCSHKDCNLANRCREVDLPVATCNFYDGEVLDFNEARKLWEDNVPHTTCEEVYGFPTGNVFVGMTYEDFCKLNEYFRIGGNDV